MPTKWFCLWRDCFVWNMMQAKIHKDTWNSFSSTYLKLIVANTKYCNSWRLLDFIKEIWGVVDLYSNLSPSAADKSNLDSMKWKPIIILSKMKINQKLVWIKEAGHVKFSVECESIRVNSVATWFRYNYTTHKTILSKSLNGIVDS